MRTFWVIMFASLLCLSNCDDIPLLTPPPQPPAFTLDHFKAYNVEIIVLVDDQFINPQPITLEAEVKFFATPVSKEDEKKWNRQAHLAWYNLKKPIPVNKDISYFNQFNTDTEKKIQLGRLMSLLVPYEKVINNSKFPKLDYYLCYEIVSIASSDRMMKVKLADQFQTVNSLPKSTPKFFCTPCSIDNEPIRNEDDHLVVYELPEDKAVNTKITIKNPLFGEHRFIVRQQKYLLVPTAKYFPSSGTGQPGKPPGIPGEPVPGKPVKPVL